MYTEDEWPKTPDGGEYDGKNLMTLVQQNKSPFHEIFDVNLLLLEIKAVLGTEVTEIPQVSKGSNHYGFHIKSSNRTDIVARLARDDINMPDFEGFSLQSQISDVKFEAAVYELLRQQPSILVSRLLFHRIPAQHTSPKLDIPKDLAGRRLFLFERAEGENNVWTVLEPQQKNHLLDQAAKIRAALYQFDLSIDFVTLWLRERLFTPQPTDFPIAIAPTREFCIALLESKIESTIGNEGDAIGWESDHNTVGPIAAKAKRSLLQLVPYIVPTATKGAPLYRFVLEHGDFGIHNMSITMDTTNQPLITSLYDWETACIVPALLSDPQMVVTVDLEVDENADPSISRLYDDDTPEELAEYLLWSKRYSKELFSIAPTYRDVIRIGKDARHLWFALRAWRGEDPEGYFGSLGSWAQKRIKELRE